MHKQRRDSSHPQPCNLRSALRRAGWQLALLSSFASAMPAFAQGEVADTPPAQQRLEDAWWTGSVVSNSPAPLPKGHAYVETYLYDAKSPGVDAWGSQIFMLYGFTDRFTAGVRPLLGYTRVDGGGGSTRVGFGDVAVHAQYALTRYSPGKRMPAIAIAVEESIPTGRHDHLDRASNGFGSGARSTTLGVYAQQYFWLPNGRILRGRLNVSKSWSERARVRDISVYGTPAGFVGSAHPGSGLAIDNAWEYSVTSHWVVATDLYYSHSGRTIVRDADGATIARYSGRTSDTFAVVPAIEYNWNSNVGMIFGVRYIPQAGHNTRSVTPVLALSIFM